MNAKSSSKSSSKPSSKSTVRELHPAVAAKLEKETGAVLATGKREILTEVPRVATNPESAPLFDLAGQVEAAKRPEGDLPKAPDSATGSTRDAALPKARKMERKIDYVVKCILALARETHGWGSSLEGDIGAARVALESAARSVASLPDTFTPPKAAPGQGRNVKPLVEGDTIDITDKAAPTYEDILDEADRKGLTVSRVIGAKVVALTLSGTKVVLPRGHVAPAAVNKRVELSDSASA